MHCLSLSVSPSEAQYKPQVQAQWNGVQQGIDLARNEQYLEAIDAFTQVLRLNPENADAYGHRCVVRYRSGDTGGAIADCHKAAELYKKQGDLTKYEYALTTREKLNASKCGFKSRSS